MELSFEIISELYINKAINIRRSYKVLDKIFGIHSVIDKLNLYNTHCIQKIKSGKNKNKLCLYKSKNCNGSCNIHNKNNFYPSAPAYEDIEINPIYVPLPEQDIHEIRLLNRRKKKKINKEYNSLGNNSILRIMHIKHSNKIEFNNNIKINTINMQEVIDDDSDDPDENKFLDLKNNNIEQTQSRVGLCTQPYPGISIRSAIQKTNMSNWIRYYRMIKPIIKV